ncbi:MAG: malonate decarboxylase holo-[acyl-carrier-protein] synthase [Burkholderiales bacterium]
MRRHDWVYPREYARLLQSRTADRDAIRFTHDWIAQRRPLVATRQSIADDTVALGLALPPGYATRRLACALRREDVGHHRGPLGVEEVAQVLTANDRRALRRLQGALASPGFVIGVYGSTAWQCVSGLSYRHEGSDIDVVCDATSDALGTRDVDACLRALDVAARDLTSRLDGEIRFADGRAVAWRELARACAASKGVVLAKGERDVALVPWQRLVEPA